MKQITIIGTGRVATHLCVALSDKVDELINVPSRTLEDLPLTSDIYIIAVSDDAITDLASRLPRLHGIVAHTSGSVPADALAPFTDQYGVFYPLQTFSKGDELDYSEIPVFVEGSAPEVVTELTWLASRFSRSVHEADSPRRRVLHIASVFACNYVNHLWTIAERLLAADSLSLDVLRPLIKATASKIQRMSPQEAQTGPAARGDRSIIDAHIKALEGTPEQEIYRMLAESILQTSNSPKSLL